MRWLLRLLVDDADRRAIESDLAELHDYRQRRDGDRAADRWLRRQRLIYPLLLSLDRGRAALSRGTTMPHLWRDVLHSAQPRRVSCPGRDDRADRRCRPRRDGAAIGVIRAVSSLRCPTPIPTAAWIYTDNPPYRSRSRSWTIARSRPTIRRSARWPPTASSVTVTDGDGGAGHGQGGDGLVFPLLGHTAALGRLFDASDDRRATIGSRC